MKQPPSIQPAPVPGPDYDPMDRIVQDLQNIESFLSFLEDNPKDLDYLNNHLSQILALRRTISHELEHLADEPYNYSASHLQKLHEENEKTFLFLEGVIGAMMQADEKEFKKAVKALEETLLQFDQDLTP